MIGSHRVTVLDPAGDLDISCYVDAVAIYHGRGDSTGQPEAPSATIDFSYDATSSEPLPTAVDVGAGLTVTTDVGAESLVRFTGRITDVAMGWDEAGPDTPDRLIGQIVAAGVLADLGRAVIGDEPWPVEKDGARVRRILELAGFPYDPLTSDPGTVDVLGRDVDRQPALDLAQGVAESGLGVLWQTRTGSVRYADAEHRRNVPVALQLDACDVLVTPTWLRNTAGLTNDVTIWYGEDNNYRVHVENAESIARYGRYAVSVSTELAAEADAEELAAMLLIRNSFPVWLMADLPVDVAGLNMADTVALLGMDMHSLVNLTGLPAAGTAPTSAPLWVEGWRESLGYGAHELVLAVSGYCRTAPAPTWDEVDPSWTWNTLGGPYVLIATNVLPNPGGESGSAGLQSGSSAAYPILMDTLAPIAGAQSWMTTRTATSPDVNVSQVQQPSASFIPVVPGDTVTYGIDVKTEQPDRQVRGYIAWRSASASTGNTTPRVDPKPDAGTTRYVYTGVVPEGATTFARLIVQVQMTAGTAPAGERAWFDRMTGVVGTADTSGAYFDGDTPDTATRFYDWTGTPHDSPSTVGAFIGGRGRSWDEMTCLGPNTQTGRWVDVPASLRWDQADSMWDTYE